MFMFLLSRTRICWLCVASAVLARPQRSVPDVTVRAPTLIKRLLEAKQQYSLPPRNSNAKLWYYYEWWVVGKDDLHHRQYNYGLDQLIRADAAQSNANCIVV